jgi:diaminohydroxyphosphoribosylaminopyrimidine deaminase/5-amino-6-(5-phosphoribosylamino)uracil reductase
LTNSSDLDLRYIKLALQLSKRRIGQTWPNPSVGCVIVKDNRIVGRGITEPGGRPHAETSAIEQAKGKCKGATLYVTLEPCSHYGATPPCVETIIKSGIRKVVCPLMDPDPRVSGAGFKNLKAANIHLDFIPIAKPWAEEVVAGFASRVTRQRPFITVKLALSLDGRIATNLGKSKWITSHLSRNRVHLLRAQNDAVLVGTGTFLHDNPKLDIRGSLENLRSPLRVFLDRKLLVFPSKSIIENLIKYPSIIAYGDGYDLNNFNIWKKTNTQLIKIPVADNKLNLKYLFRMLADRGITSLLIEGGGKLVTNLLLDNLIDKLVVYRSGLILGSNGLPSFLEILNSAQEIKDYPKFVLKTTNQYGDDIESIWDRSDLSNNF